jgi:hypothetical protein
MAIGWLALLAGVPWSEVIKNAPKVADGAKKLWKAIAQKPSGPEAFSSRPRAAAASESQAIAALEAAVADLHGQMLASSELIKALAEQNAQLVLRIETNRHRLLWLSIVTAVLAIAAVLGLLMAFSRPGA